MVKDTEDKTGRNDADGVMYLVQAAARAVDFFRHLTLKPGCVVNTLSPMFHALETQQLTDDYRALFMYPRDSW